MQQVLITGCAGFIGQNLVDNLLKSNAAEQVIGVDNFYSSQKNTALKMQKAFGKRFLFIEGDVRDPGLASQIQKSSSQSLSHIFHLACPASPPAYMKDPLLTWETSVMGTRHMLELAHKSKARFLFTSTSEVYGDPQVHPQPESYFGSVNTWGPRACYDEGKRAAESLCYIYERLYKTEVRVARIFNTYGPGMDLNDGRVITSLFSAFKRGEPLPVFGTGKQTRSFCYVEDMVAGLKALMESEVRGPVNLGNPQEKTILELATMVQGLKGDPVPVTFHPLPQDDPKQRCPDISRARKELRWEPRIEFNAGFLKFWDWIQQNSFI